MQKDEVVGTHARTGAELEEVLQQVVLERARIPSDVAERDQGEIAADQRTRMELVGMARTLRARRRQLRSWRPPE